MKKIFTLLFSVGIVGSVFAQSGRQDRFKVSNDVAFNKPPQALMQNHESSYKNTYMMDSRDNDRRLNERGSNYGKQRMAIEYNRHFMPFEHQNQINTWVPQRDQRREMKNRFSYHDRNYRNNHRW